MFSKPSRMRWSSLPYCASPQLETSRGDKAPAFSQPLTPPAVLKPLLSYCQHARPPPSVPHCPAVTSNSPPSPLLLVTPGSHLPVLPTPTVLSVLLLAWARVNFTFNLLNTTPRCPHWALYFPSRRAQISALKETLLQSCTSSGDLHTSFSPLQACRKNRWYRCPRVQLSLHCGASLSVLHALQPGFCLCHCRSLSSQDLPPNTQEAARPPASPQTNQLPLCHPIIPAKNGKQRNPIQFNQHRLNNHQKAQKSSLR